jgi:hypothetical protein
MNTCMAIFLAVGAAHLDFNRNPDRHPAVAGARIERGVVALEAGRLGGPPLLGNQRRFAQGEKYAIATN